MIKIPLIASDLRFDEVSIRAIKTFDYLDAIVDEIFNRIDARIDQNMNRISQINNRLEKASEKIERLKKSKKAIRMFSPARYPIESPPKFHPTFDKSFHPAELEFNYKLDLPFESIQYKQYSDKLQFFHLKSPKRNATEMPNLIFNASSINSLITFVNNENIYLKESIKLKEREVNQSDSKTNDDDTTDFSRFSNMIKSKQHGDNFHYLPSFNQAPEFEFPLDLPDLEGIAGDISFSVTDEELQAPTLRSMNFVNELPNIIELIQERKSEIIDVPPPPPPPSIPMNLNIPIPPPAPPVNILIPPPPPPPPMMMMQKTDIPAPVAASSSSSADDPRSSLMKAIREAGGKAKAKLKTIPAAEEQASDVKKVAKPPAMDLMSDLHQKLMLRRKGIAGSKEAKKEKNSIMNRVSSMIPPPPKKKDESDSDSSDNNDNDDDWN